MDFERSVQWMQWLCLDHWNSSLEEAPYSIENEWEEWEPYLNISKVNFLKKNRISTSINIQELTYLFKICLHHLLQILHSDTHGSIRSQLTVFWNLDVEHEIKGIANKKALPWNWESSQRKQPYRRRHGRWWRSPWLPPARLLHTHTRSRSRRTSGITDRC